MSTRKDFIVGACMVSAATPLAAAAAPAAAPQAGAPGGSLPKFVFDRAAFRAMLAKPARHRQCFGATKLEGGTMLYEMRNSMEAYDDDLGEGPGALHAAGVLYHGAAIALAMTDDLWNAYLIPAGAALPDTLKNDLPRDLRPGDGNPFLRSATKGRVSVESLVARGASFFVCRNAIVGFADVFAKALARPRSEIYERVMRGIVPGALVVPSGVMAINACQEAHFAYIEATL